MKGRTLSLVVVGALVSGPAFIGTAHAQTAKTAASSDAALDKRIEARINSSSLKKYGVHVSVDKGVATLTGTVATDADRAKATQVATIPGVTRVDNQLIVDLDAATKGTAGKFEEKTKAGAEKTKAGAAKAADKTKEGADKAWEKTKEGAGTVADKTKEGVSKTGEVITDGWITTRVKSKFVDESVLKDSDISVTTNNHVVTLTGTVPTAAGRARAVEQAKEVEGVHQVIDRLTIGPKKQ